MYSTKSICHDKTFWAICYNQHLHLLHWMYVHTIITDACHKDDMQPLFFMLKSFCFISGVQCGLSHSWNQALTTHTCQSNCLQCSHSFIQNLPHLWNRCKLGLKSSPFLKFRITASNFPFIKSSSLFPKISTSNKFTFLFCDKFNTSNPQLCFYSYFSADIPYLLFPSTVPFRFPKLPLAHVIQPQSISNWHFSISFLHIISSFCFFYYISCDLDLVLPHTPPPSWFHFSGTFHDFQWDSPRFSITTECISRYHLQIQSCNSFHACGNIIECQNSSIRFQCSSVSVLLYYCIYNSV